MSGQGQSREKNGAEKIATEEPEPLKSRAEFSRRELRRLHTSMQREKTKIKRPEVKSHTPFTFNNLGPYLDMNAADFIVKKEPNSRRPGYITRHTAIGLVDPWRDLGMDTSRPESETVPGAAHRPLPPRSARFLGPDTSRSKQGSTHLPKYPVVSLKNPGLATKEFDYGEVPSLREAIGKTYSQSGHDEIQKEYVRTKQDFYRMELDKMREMQPLNRQNLRAAYFAYLQNTPGARKAVYECIRELDVLERSEQEKKEEERKHKEEQEEERTEKPAQQSDDVTQQTA